MASLNDEEHKNNEKLFTNGRRAIPPTGTKLVHSDYNMPCLTLAKDLLGQYLCRRLDSGVEVRGIIVETEAYIGGDDKASMSFGGKKTERNAPMYMDAGTAFVYMTYGMYYCLNISSKGDGAAVLIRAVEPLSGIEGMRENRERSYRGKSTKRQNKGFNALELCNGPSKLCMSFAIDKSLNKEDMIHSMKIWVERPLNLNCERISEVTVACSRIGIDSAGKEWASKPLRFYIKGNPYISKKDKKAEQNMNS